MRSISRIQSLGLGLLLAVPLASGLSAAERFQLTTRTVEISEVGQRLVCVVLMDTNQICFLPPRNWQIRLDAQEKRLTLSSADRNASIIVRVLPQVSAKPADLKVETLRRHIQEQYPGATIKEEFECFASVGPGQGFDLERPSASGAKFSSRVAYVPIPGALAELSLVTRTEAFAGCQWDFANLLHSFSVEALSAEKH